MKYRLVLKHQPLFDPNVAFEFPHRYYRWFWLARIMAHLLLWWYPNATDVVIYKRT